MAGVALDVKASQVAVPDPSWVMEWLVDLGPDPSRVMAMRQPLLVRQQVDVPTANSEVSISQQAGVSGRRGAWGTYL